MDIILDTNILFQDMKFKSAKFNALISYLRKTNSSLLLPQIVLEESVQKFRDHLTDLKLEIENRKKNIERYLYTNAEGLAINIDIDENVKLYKEKILNVTESVNILEYKPEFLSEIVKRLIQCIKPASKKKREFRDIILWLTIIDYIRKNDYKQTAFISSNTDDFADDSNIKLHKDLISELAKAKNKLLYFNSIEEFLKQKSKLISEIDEEWLESNIIIKEINNKLISLIEDTNNYEYWLSHYLDYYDNRYFGTGDIQLLYVNLKLDDYFINDFYKNELFLYLNYSGVLVFEVPDESQFTMMDNQLDFMTLYGKPETRLINVDIYANFTATIINEEVKDLELDNWGRNPF